MVIPQTPFWVKAIADTAKQPLAVLALIAMGLVYWVTQVQDARMIAIQADMAKTSISAVSAHESMIRAETMMAAFAKDARDFDQQQIMLLYQICVSVSAIPANCQYHKEKK